MEMKSHKRPNEKAEKRNGLNIRQIHTGLHTKHVETHTTADLNSRRKLHSRANLQNATKIQRKYTHS